jgi:hypothetical protein
MRWSAEVEHENLTRYTHLITRLFGYEPHDAKGPTLPTIAIHAGLRKFGVTRGATCMNEFAWQPARGAQSRLLVCRYRPHVC